MNHHETIKYVISFPLSAVVLGLPWLKSHNPQIHWSAAPIVGIGAVIVTLIASDLLYQLVYLFHSIWEYWHVPSEYHDLKQVFSKDRAPSLPLHRPSDCPIDLLPGAPLPTKKLYNLSKTEKEAIENYIQDSLSARLIRPSSSPVGAGFFFVEKRDASLRPCTDYRGLNDNRVKNKYPLPLIDSAFGPLHESVIFQNLASKILITWSRSERETSGRLHLTTT